jgi:uncharacterized protein DUF6194
MVAPMTMDEILAFVSERFADVTVLVASEENGAPPAAWGDAFCTYTPETNAGDGGREAAGFEPFATVVTKDYEGFDTTSNLDREGVFRLNVSVGRRAFDAVLGEGWRNRVFDPAALDVLMPHPVYAAQGWVSILNPSEGSRPTVERLLSAAYDRAVARRGAA